MTNTAPKLVPHTRKTRKGSRVGVRERGSRLTAYVKLGSGKGAINRTRDFPSGTPDWELQKWRTETLDELKALKPVKGTLRADIDR